LAVNDKKEVKPAAKFTVIATKKDIVLDKFGRIVPGFKINYETERGSSGFIEIPEKEYFKAKVNIVRYQKPCDSVLLPAELLNDVKPYCHSMITEIPDELPLAWRSIISSQEVGFEQNWRVILATLELLSVDIHYAAEPVKRVLEHRMEHVKTIQGVTFINDSKSTVSQATLAAVDLLYPNRISLLLGGLSKGVSRECLVRKLHGKVENIICFGVRIGGDFKVV